MSGRVLTPGLVAPALLPWASVLLLAPLMVRMCGVFISNHLFLLSTVMYCTVRYRTILYRTVQHACTLPVPLG